MYIAVVSEGVDNLLSVWALGFNRKSMKQHRQQKTIEVIQKQRVVPYVKVNANLFYI